LKLTEDAIFAQRVKTWNCSFDLLGYQLGFIPAKATSHGPCVCHAGDLCRRLHYARRRQKKGKDWRVEKVVISLEAIITHNARLHLTSIFFWHWSSLTLLVRVVMVHNLFFCHDVFQCGIWHRLLSQHSAASLFNALLALSHPTHWHAMSSWWQSPIVLDEHEYVKFWSDIVSIPFRYWEEGWHDEE
jgi:hypothetical protein